MHDLLAAYDQQVRRVSDFDGVERTDRVIRILLPHWRGVMWSDLDETTADAAIDTVQTDASDDSRPILERLGFIPVGTTTPFIHP